MNTKEFYYRVKYRLNRYRVKKNKTPNYFNLYASYWHRNNSVKNMDMSNLYMTEVPQYGAGIGHQLANWIAGYWFAKFFNVKYAYSPFTSSAVPFSPNKWDRVLGFGEKETTAEYLLKHGYKKVLLPYFDENNSEHLDVIRKIISSYAGQKIVFFLEANQFYHDQFGVMEEIGNKFFNAPARKKDKLIYDDKYYNVAMHIRRQVVIDSKVIVENEEQRAKRWTGNEYYEEVLKTLVKLNVGEPIRIHVFSTGKPEEFESFKKYGDVRICSDLDEYESFVHLVFADLLVTSKSSFSYKPALMSKGVKVCPDGFWHGYPDKKDWFVVSADGMLNSEQISRMSDVIKEKS